MFKNFNRILFFGGAFLVSRFACGAVGGEEQLIQEDQPWFTGPLLTPSALVVPYGKVNIEPYVYLKTRKASYDAHGHSKNQPKFTEYNPQLICYIGVTECISFQFTPQLVSSRTEGQSSTHIGDLPLGFDFQLFAQNERPWAALKFYIRETLPTGHYQKLDPSNLGTDASGKGSFATQAGFIFSKEFHYSTWHYLRPRLALFGQYSHPVHVRGFNSYGGGFGAAGKVFPGAEYTALLGLEYSLSQRWALALDIKDVYNQKVRFKGQKGIGLNGAPASLGGGSSYQLSVAPALEYNFNEKMGLIGGSWFTLAGRNSTDFLTWVIAFNYYN